MVKNVRCSLNFYFSKQYFLDTSNENDLNGSGKNNQNVNNDKIPSAPFEKDDSNEILVENQSNVNILTDGQNRIAILQSYDSYPDGDTKGRTHYVKF